jgi:hypothetical protein
MFGDDDDMEIEVAPQAPKRAPRVANPAVDNVIHSGEIVEPRSSIIRSGSMPKMDNAAASRELGELKAPSPRRRARFIWLAAAIACALGAGALIMFDRPQPPVANTDAARVNLTALAHVVGSTLDADARAAMVRAQAIATSSMLRAGIETDAQTLMDMAHDHDMTMPVGAGEVIEVLQIRDGASVLMVRIPNNVAALPRVATGKTLFETTPTGLRTIASAAISNTSGDVRGAIVLAVPVDLAPAKTQARETTTTLVGLGPPIALARTTPAAMETTVTVPVETEGQAKLSLETAVPVVPVIRDRNLLLLRGACIILAGLFMLVFIGTSLRRPQRALQ